MFALGPSVWARTVRLVWIVTVAVAAALSPDAAPGAIEYYDIVTGKRTSTFDPEGTDFRSHRAFIVAFRDQSPQIVIATGGSFRFWNVVTGDVEELRVNFKFVGGDFGGRLLFQVSPSEIIGFRDAVGSELALIGPSGINVYNACGDRFSTGDPCADDGSAEGDLVAIRNATLSGGDFEGSRFSEIPAAAYLGYRDGAKSQIALLGASGINYYDIVTGEEHGIFDPPLTDGGPFDGRRFSELAPNDFAGFRDAAESQIALVPAMGTVPGAAVALATLGLVARRRRRREAGAATAEGLPIGARPMRPETR